LVSQINLLILAIAGHAGNMPGFPLDNKRASPNYLGRTVCW